VEGDLAVGEVFGAVVGVVDAAVVVSAEEPAGRQVGVAALGPGLVVVGVAHRGRPIAVLRGAALVSDAQGDALSL
jgi:hypothetical protein